MAKVAHTSVYKLILLVLFPLNCFGYPSGAPQTVCQSLEPHHGVPPQKSRVPYIISADRQQNGQSGDQVTVTIRGNEFRGYILQARDAETGSQIIDGIFETPNGGKIVSCNGGKNSITHTGKDSKYELRAIWTPPPSFSGDVIFRSTVLKDFSTFWMNVDSSPMRVNGAQGSQQDKSRSPSDYSDCGTKRGCVGLPGGCIERKNCQVFGTFLASPTGVEFELVGAVSPDVWIAIGLSEDDKMGSDSVTECVLSNGVVRVQHSWNEGKQNQPLSQGLQGIRDASGEFAEGVITCRWKRDYITNVRGATFDTEKNKYFLLLAKGPPGYYAGKGVHDGISISSSPINLTSIIVTGLQKKIQQKTYQPKIKIL